MKDLDNILGNEDLRSRLASDIRHGTLSHAYIIEGENGSGKHTLATEIAAALSCEKKDSGEPIPCGKCSACRKILGHKATDVITVSREDGKSFIGVDVIRGMREDVRLVPNDFDTKVYIIEDAHLMNIQAQNAFLLTLEEPPKFVVFLLLCTSSKPLLETIRSRAPILRMRPLDENLLRASLIRENTDAAMLEREAPHEFGEILKLSSGYMGKAIELLGKESREPLIKSRHFAVSFITALTLRRSGKRSAELIASFPTKREELRELLSQIELAARDLMLVKKCDSPPLCFFSNEEQASELSMKFKASDLMALISSLEGARALLAANSNVRLTLYSLAVKNGLL